MLGLKLLKLSINVITKDKNFSVSIPFNDGLNVIRAENSSGKSTFVNSIAYALGLESILGPGRRAPFPAAITNAIFLNKNKNNNNEQGFFVVGSFVDLEVSNKNGDIVCLRREVKGNPDKITVVSKGEAQDFFLKSAGSVGSAISELGFHNWLAKFIGWNLPMVPRFDGSLAPLYLECIFPLFFIEQKRGWSEIQANAPLYYKIKNLKKTALEFCLGVSDFSRRGDVEKYKVEIKQLEIQWEGIKSSFKTLGELNGLLVNFDCDIDSDDYVRLGVLYHVSNGDRITVGDYLSNLQRRIRKIDQDLQGWSFGHELDAAISERQLISEKIFALSEKNNNIEATSKKINRKLVSLENDLDRYKQLRRLISVGAKNGINIETKNCPVCDTKLQESFTPVEDGYEPMTIDQNIAYLEDQKKFYDAINSRNNEELRAGIVQGRSMQSELERVEVLIGSFKDEERKYLDAFGNEIKEVAELKFLEREFQKIISQRDKLNASAEVAFKEHSLKVESLEIAMKSDLGGVSKEIFDALKSRLIANLQDFSYKNMNIHALDISNQTFRPELDGFDIVADISASDSIRIIWAYTLALMELGVEFDAVKHGGFVVFDEPRQHEASHESFIALLKKSKEKFSEKGQVIIATSIPVADMAVLGLDESCLTVFNDGEYMIQ